jgi:hypothetical protein
MLHVTYLLTLVNCINTDTSILVSRPWNAANKSTFTMSKPTFLFCPGAWHTTDFFDKIIVILKPLGYRCITIPMPSVGSKPATKGIDEDIAAIRTVVLEELEAGKDVVINAHSWAGIPVSSGLYGLGKDERQRDGSTGAVTKLTFVSSFVIPEGMSLLDTMGGKPDAWVVDEVRRPVLKYL